MKTLETLAVVLRDRDQGVQALDGGVDVPGFLGDDLQGVGGKVFRQQDVPGIVDQTPGRRQGLQLHPVILG